MHGVLYVGVSPASTMVRTAHDALPACQAGLWALMHQRQRWAVPRLLRSC